MILETQCPSGDTNSKPRASGDDPAVRAAMRELEA